MVKNKVALPVIKVPVDADLWSPFWPSSLILRSSRSSSSRLRIASRRVALSCSIPPSSLWSSSMRLSFFSLASSVLCIEALTDFSQLGSLGIIICFLVEKE
ncbi:hypothetical protein INR49_005520 [Caranx melampygus]|nr:hypothetical protein INR49_005520 [Caranx melampygus]